MSKTALMESLSRLKIVVLAISLTLLCALLYARTLDYGFTYDDLPHIINNPLISGASWSWGSFKATFWAATPPGNLYRPLTSLSYQLNALLAGLDPWSFHLVNLLLHLIVVSLIVHLVAEVTNSGWIAGSSAALFLVHPIHVEAVANVVGRAELLSLMFLLLAILALRRTHQVGSYFVSNLPFVFFGLATLCKESALAALFILPLFLPLIANGSHAPRRWFIFTKFAAVGAATLGLRWVALGPLFLMASDHHTIYPENPIFHLAWYERIIPALKVLGDELLSIALPIHLSADYSAMPDQLFAQVYSWTGLLNIALFLGFLSSSWSLRRTKLWLFALWFPATILLTSNIVVPIGTIRADRLLYTPSLGPIVMLAYYCEKQIGSIKSRTLVLLALITLFSLQSYQRLPVWRNNAALFQATVINAPQSPKAWLNYGVYLRDEVHNRASAQQAIATALQLHPNYILALKVAADFALTNQDLTTLEDIYNRILQLKPDEDFVRQQLTNLKKLKVGKHE